MTTAELIRLPDGSWGVRADDLEPGQYVRVTTPHGINKEVLVGRVETCRGETLGTVVLSERNAAELIRAAMGIMDYAAGTSADGPVAMVLYERARDALNQAQLVCDSSPAVRTQLAVALVLLEAFHDSVLTTVVRDAVESLENPLPGGDAGLRIRVYEGAVDCVAAIRNARSVEVLREKLAALKP